ncbi:efflux RND transporter periplasmic adaptor subunit [Clostridium formicaceticum]|uniref:Efflux system component YknX n=1 Tax=Clostridium formicaceticum TaxID=1497 RepID=A0AAC9WER8_9CLOT|nr:efflux RND transporter periplasmic adaptor subunit [Clostridium formicaceticum]AOY75732.1 hypothetical protein BJL90_07370 [Clostridium formicaceticum]ARE86052.1 Putative efflux system component YknX [Clostridium formicaceticum]
MSKSKSKKKIIIFAVIMVIIAVTIVTAAAMRGKEQEISVDVFTLKKGEITVTVPANGILEEVERQTIYTEDSAKVLSIEVEEGDHVTAGQVLALLDGDDLEIQLNIKEKNLEMNKIELAKLEKIYGEEKTEHNRRLESASRKMEEAKRDFDRDKELYEHGAISQQEYRQSERNFEDAVESYEEIQAKVYTTEFDIDRMKKSIAVTELEIREIQNRIEKQEDKILSSINGVVTAIHLEEGSFVNPANPGFVISNIEDLTIEIKVSEYDIAKVELGQEVEIQTDAITGKTFKGIVEKISPVAKRESTGQTTETIIPVTIKVEEKDDLLKPGFSVKTRIISQQKEGVLVVPFDTITMEANGAKTVFIVKEEVLHKVEVQTGIESDFEIEIVDGLQEDDKIVLNPSMYLQEGMKVVVNER